jgi:cytochrome c peroxidase
VVTLLATALAAAALFAPAQGAPAKSEYRWNLPAGLPQPFVPADNPMSEAKVALGRALFSDARLSITGEHSCQSCHDPARAFTDGLIRSRGALQEELPLNAPTLLNAAYNPSLGWNDASVRTLEQQMRGPLFNEHPRELGLAGREWLAERKLAGDPDLVRAFQRAFPRERQPVTMDNVIRAIAAFERTLLSADSAFDRYAFRGEHDALDAEQKHGMELFFSSRTGCSGCHGGINFAGPWVDADHPKAEPVFADTGTGIRVRVPTLRNLGATAPYLHDGRLATLASVLDHYERLASDPAADPRLRRKSLTTRDRAALLAFLCSLDSY